MQALLDAFGINASLLIAQAVNFGIVLIALWYFLYKPVLAVIAKRQAFVAKGVEDAVLANEKLANADSEAFQRVSVSETEAEKIVALARETAQVEKQRLLKEADARAVAIGKDAEDRATEVAARMRRESEQEIARLAMLSAEKILKQKYD